MSVVLVQLYQARGAAQSRDSVDGLLCLVMLLSSHQLRTEAAEAELKHSALWTPGQIQASKKFIRRSSASHSLTLSRMLKMMRCRVLQPAPPPYICLIIGCLSAESGRLDVDLGCGGEAKTCLHPPHASSGSPPGRLNCTAAVVGASTICTHRCLNSPPPLPSLFGP